MNTASIRPADLTHPIIASLISVIVNYGGTFILVFQGAKVAGLSPEQTASWIWSVSIGVGLTGAWLSFRYREPIITAWSGLQPRARSACANRAKKTASNRVDLPASFLPCTRTRPASGKCISTCLSCLKSCA